MICLNKKQCIAMCRFRTNKTCLPKVIGRFKQPKVEWHKRFCTLCNETKLGDEYHILFECSNEKVILNRLQYVSKFYLKRPSMFQCINLMRSENNKDIRNLSLFLINVICLYKWFMFQAYSFVTRCNIWLKVTKGISEVVHNVYPLRKLIKWCPL